jgi:hypothetical protein
VTPDLVRRQEATGKTMARYRRKAFDWARGLHCVALARFHMKAMGHSPPALPKFRSAVGAKKALDDKGFDSVTDMMDAILPRITPAEMLLGDLAAVEGDQGLDSIMVCAGPLRVFGWREGEDKMVVLGITLDELKAAWRL